MTVAADILNRLSQDAQMVKGAFKTAVFDYGTGILGLVETEEYQPGNNAKVEIEADLGAAEVYTEGQVLPAPVESTYLIANFAFKDFRAVIRQSGRERRALGSQDQGALTKDPARKITRAYAAIRNLLAKTFDDNAAYGVEGQVDATIAYGDQDRATYLKLKAYVLAAGSVRASTALLNKWVNLGADDPYGAAPDVVLGSSTQCHIIADLHSEKLVFNGANPQSLIPTGLLVGTAPLIMVPNLTTSILIGMTGVRNGNWRVIWNEENPGRFHVLDLGAANSDTPMNLQISTSLALVHDNPNEQMKMTGLATS